MLAPFNSKIRKIRSQKKKIFFFTEIKEPKGAQQFSIFTRAPLAPFWLLRLLNFRRPPKDISNEIKRSKIKKQYLNFTTKIAPNHSVWKSQKSRIWIFQFWHFPTIFVLLKVTYLKHYLTESFRYSKPRQIDQFWHF